MFSVSNISVQFGQVKILRSVSFQVETGGTVGIIGPNGSGKTTLFNAISGFAPLTDGSIIIHEKDISKLPPHARAVAGLCRVFQNFGVFKQLTVLENVVLALQAKLTTLQALIPSRSRWKRYTDEALSFLEMVGLKDKHALLAGSLSGGQLRLLEMARALASNAEVYLLDEPTAGVSPKLKDEVSRAIQQLIQRKKTVLVIEHDMSFIRTFVQRIIVLDQGQITMDDTPAEVVQSPRLKELYFGSLV